jgi:hypothetical protein
MTTEPKDILLKILQRQSGLTDSDLQSLENTAKFLLEKNWNDADILDYLSLTEEYSPHLSEEFALAQMKRISDKYPNHSK